LVTGAHRTGTTWVGKMLAASGEAGYISEPLNLLHRPGVMRSPVDRWYPYICQENQADYYPALRETLAFRYHLWAELCSLHSRTDVLRMGRDWWTFTRGRLLRQRPLLKDPFAVFSIPWFVQRLNCQVVVTVRHPAAFVSSLKRLNWPFDFNDLLSQPLLMKDWLGAFKNEMEAAVAREKQSKNQANAAVDIIGQASLLWRMIYWVVARVGNVHVIRHEDLSVIPIEGYRGLYQSLGLNFNDRAQQVILNSSSSENPKEASSNAIYTTRIDSQANLHNWKKRLSTEEIAHIRQITEDVAAQYYPDLAWE
jgi:hypothetical protein